MKLTPFILLIALLTAFTSIAQDIPGYVVSQVPLGSSEYFIIQEQEGPNYYKTSPHPVGELFINDEVIVRPNGSIGNYQIISSQLTQSLFADKIEEPELTLSLTNLPVFDNDILVFDSQEHLDEFYSELENYIENSTYDLDEILDEFESLFPGYISFRTKFNNDHDWINGSFTDEELREIYELDFVNDPIQKTLLNHHLELGVGSTFYYWHGPRLTFSTDITDQDNRDILGSLVPYTPVDVARIEGFSGINVFSVAMNFHRGSLQIGSFLKYETHYQYYFGDCNPMEVVFDVYMNVCTRTSTLHQFSCDYYPNNFELSIDWGDGNVTNNITWSPGDLVSHEYAAIGTYNVTLTAVFIDQNANTQTIVDDVVVEVSSQTCTNSPAQFWYAEVQGNWKLAAKLWVTQSTFFGKKVGSYSHAWVKNNNVWVRQKARKLQTSVSGIFRNGQCFWAEEKSGSHNKNWAKYASKTKSRLFERYKVGNGDVQSTHYLQKGNYEISFTISLNPC